MVRTDVAAENEALFNDIYDREHIPAFPEKCTRLSSFDDFRERAEVLCATRM
jgi:hypothetical protein